MSKTTTPQTPHTIEVEITPEGKIVAVVKGVAGPNCAPLSEWLNELGEVTLDSKTADFTKPREEHLKIRS